jgi:hypothetical protein
MGMPVNRVTQAEELLRVRHLSLACVADFPGYGCSSCLPLLKPSCPWWCPCHHLQGWRREAAAEVSLAKEVGPPSAINLVTRLEQDVDFLCEYYQPAGQFDVSGL